MFILNAIYEKQRKNYHNNPSLFKIEYKDIQCLHIEKQ